MFSDVKLRIGTGSQLVQKLVQKSFPIANYCTFIMQEKLQTSGLHITLPAVLSILLKSNSCLHHYNADENRLASSSVAPRHQALGAHTFLTCPYPYTPLVFLRFRDAAQGLPTPQNTSQMQLAGSYGCIWEVSETPPQHVVPGVIYTSSPT